MHNKEPKEDIVRDIKQTHTLHEGSVTEMSTAEAQDRMHMLCQAAAEAVSIEVEEAISQIDIWPYLELPNPFKRSQTTSLPKCIKLKEFFVLLTTEPDASTLSGARLIFTRMLCPCDPMQGSCLYRVVLEPRGISLFWDLPAEGYFKLQLDKDSPQSPRVKEDIEAYLSGDLAKKASRKRDEILEDFKGQVKKSVKTEKLKNIGDFVGKAFDKWGVKNAR